MKIPSFLMFLFLLQFSSFAGKSLDRIVAVVGDSVILSSELDAFTYMKMSQEGIQPADTLQLEMLKKRFLDEMISGKVLLVHAGKDTNIVVEDFEIENQVKSRISLILDQNNISEEQFKQEIEKQQGISFSKFKEQLRTNLRQEIIRQKVQQIYISHEISKNDIIEFYDTYRDSIPPADESVLMAQIVRKITPTTDVRQKAFSKINSIKEKLDQGGDFSEIAKKYSEGPNADQGGNLGFISRGSLSLPAFEKRCFSLNVNETSKPFESRIGFHIIRINEKKEQQVNVSQILIKISTPKKEIEKAFSLLDSIRSNCCSDSAFKKCVAKYSQDDVSKSQDGLLKWQIIAGLDKDVADAIDTLKENEITRPIKTGNKITIYKLIDRKQQRELTLEDDYGHISQIAQNVILQERLMNIVEEWKKETYIDIRL